MLAAILALTSAFTAPGHLASAPTRAYASAPTRAHVSAIGDFKLPDLPKLPLPDLPNPFAEEFRLFPDDVQFTDVDGDEVVLRPKLGKVDFYVNKKLRMENCRIAINGDTIEISGTMQKGTPLSFLGFNIVETVTEGAKPRDPAALELAGKLAM